MKMTDEVMEKARSAENSAALLALAKENGIELTQEEAEGLFERMHRKGELSDQELENVTGGCGGSSKPKPGPIDVTNREITCSYWECYRCHSHVIGTAYSPVDHKYVRICSVCRQRAVCTNCEYVGYGDNQGELAVLCQNEKQCEWERLRNSWT